MKSGGVVEGNEDHSDDEDVVAVDDNQKHGTTVLDLTAIDSDSDAENQINQYE